jgi:hypothetical protein
VSRVGAVFDDELGQINVTMFKRGTHQGMPVLVLGCHISAKLDEERGKFYTGL